MLFGSVCSGIEAASVAWHPLGWRAAWLAEIEPFPCALLAHHYPEVPNIGDMTTLPALIASGEVESPDLFCGGTPCQAFSVAGLRRSLDDARGNLSLVFCEIANAIDTARAARGEQPAIVFWENVPGVLNTKDNAFGCFLAGLAGEDDALVPPGGKWADAGAVFGPARAVAWRVLDAQYFGLAQRRRRVFVVASARDDFDPAAVLLEFDGVRRDSAPSREAGEGTAVSGIKGAAIGRKPDAGPQYSEHLHDGTCYTLNCVDQHAVVTGGLGVATYECGGIGAYPATTHTLRGEGFDASEDGTGRGTPLVPHVVGALACNTGPNGHDAGNFACNQAVDAGHVLPVAFDTTQITSATNRSNPQPGDPCHTLAKGAHAPAVAVGADCFNGSLTGDVAATMGTRGSSQNASGPTLLTCSQQAAVAVALRGRDGGATAELGDEVQNCLRASSGGGDKPHVLAALQVRRLTPRECERLQGFPDDYTLIPYRNKPAADGPRYKALGNSWAVPVVRWIGQRIAAHLLEGLA